MGEETVSRWTGREKKWCFGACDVLAILMWQPGG